MCHWAPLHGFVEETIDALPIISCHRGGGEGEGGSHAAEEDRFRPPRGISIDWEVGKGERPVTTMMLQDLGVHQRANCGSSVAGSKDLDLDLYVVGFKRNQNLEQRRVRSRGQLRAGRSHRRRLREARRSTAADSARLGEYGLVGSS